MKAVFFSKEYPLRTCGGVNAHIKNLTAQLGKFIDVECRYFGQKEKKPELNPSFYSFEGIGEIGSNKSFREILNAISTNLMMVDKTIDADIIHAHTWYGSLAGFFAKELYKLPLISTVHNLESMCPWKKEQLGNAYVLSLWMEKTGIENSDRVITVSNEMKERVLKNFDISEEKVTVIHNGIDLDKYKNKDGKESLEKYGINFPYILFVGRLSKQKGISVLIEAMEKLKSDTELVILANSPDTPDIEKEVREKLKGKNNITWINKMLSEDELIEFYNNTELFVCPSIYEPFGIINLEAMACKVPVVATSVGGVKEVVVDGETGLLVPPEKPEDLAEAIDTVLGDSELRTRFGENGRKRVETMFSWESVARKLIAIYEDILKK